MVRKRKAGGRLGGLRLRWWERAIAWLRRVLGLDKQRPSPLKEFNVWRT